MACQQNCSPRSGSRDDRAARGGSGRTARFLFPATALALTGCVNHAPRPLEPDAVLTELLRRSEEPAPVAHDGPGSTEWFPFEAEVGLADGLTLAEANALALYYAPQVRVARAGARVTGALVLKAGVLANPQLFAGPRVSSADSSLIFPASLSWELPLWGRRDAEREVAIAQLEERERAVIDVELETLVAVREAYLRLGRRRREEVVLSAAAAASVEVVEWVAALRRVGEVDAAALFLARAENDEAHAALESARADALRTRRALLAVVGLHPDAAVEPLVDETSEGMPPLGEPDPDALLRVPSVRAAEAAYESAEAALRLEILRQYPTIRIGPEFEDDRGDSSFGVGVGVTLPVFNRNEGGIAAALEARDEAGERYRSALLQTLHDAAAARDDLAASDRLLSLYRDGAMRDAEEASASLVIRLRTGRAEVFEVLSAQRAIARARVRVIELEERVNVQRMRAAVASGRALRRPSSSADDQADQADPPADMPADIHADQETGK